MHTVPPGDETGIYHITVSNLPWSCSWQKLKDFARNVDSDGRCINIEHAEVFSGSTCGWVRIRGKDDFLKARAHLHGGVLDRRPLIVDWRNETQSISLRDPAHISPRRNIITLGADSSSGNCVYAPSSLMSPYSEMDFSSQWGYPQSPMSSSFSPSSYGQQTQAMYENSNTMQYNYAPPNLMGGIGFAGHMAAATPVYMNEPIVSAPAPYGFPVPMLCPSPLPNTISPPSYLSQPPNTSFSNFKSKIVMTQIPPQTTTSELREHLRSGLVFLGMDTNSPEMWRILQGLKIEGRGQKDGGKKMLVFCAFPTGELARAVVGWLNGRQLKGKTLRAKLAKDGAGVGHAMRVEDGTQGAHLSPLPERRREGRGNMLKRDKETDKAPKAVVSQQDEGATENVIGSPVVVDGTGSFVR